MPSTTQPTELLYMTDSNTELEGGNILELITNENGRQVVILDRTIFYPQGGGQPYDQGTIESNEAVFNVEEVRFIQGVVHHIGEFVSGSLKAGETVMQKVDQQRRMYNTKLHSSGHLIDIALRNIGYSDITPLKGYHFPDGPYVEYVGEVNGEDIVNHLQEEIDRLVTNGYEVITKMSSLEEAKEVCYFLPEYIPSDKPVRIVSVWNTEYIPCGGTHVSNISELAGLKVKEIKSKKGNTRVSYTI